MKVRDVSRAIEELAPAGWAYSWDRSGLAIGSPEALVDRVLVALTVTRKTVQAAKRVRANLLVVHHPPIWEPLGALRTDDPATRLCLDLVEAKISCYAAHTNLDVAPGGVNTVLAERLGLVDTGPLLSAPHATQVKLVTFVPESHLAAVRDAVCSQGAGVIGEYAHCSFSSPGTGTFLPSGRAKPFSGAKHRVNEEPERRFEVLAPKARLTGILAALETAHPYEEVAYDIVTLENRDTAVGLGVRGRLPAPLGLDAFAKHVRKTLEVDHVRLCGARKRRVQTVGVIGGAGADEISNVPHDLDVLVTGDVRYHDALAAESRGIAVVDAGHAGTEKWIVPVLAQHIRRTCKGVRVSTVSEPDAFRLVT